MIMVELFSKELGLNAVVYLLYNLIMEPTGTLYFINKFKMIEQLKCDIFIFSSLNHFTHVYLSFTPLIFIKFILTMNSVRVWMPLLRF